MSGLFRMNDNGDSSMRICLGKKSVLNLVLYYARQSNNSKINLIVYDERLEYI